MQARTSEVRSSGVGQVMVTDLLYRRTSRAPRPRAEQKALNQLSRTFAEEPEKIFQSLTDAALSVCEGDSAGISVLETVDGVSRFRWRAISGTYAVHLGGMTPRDFSPCGTTIDRNSPQLVSHPERHFAYFNEVKPWVSEVLLVPFSLNEKPVGTVWVLTHDERRRFDMEDTRVLTTLASFAAAGYALISELERKKSAASRSAGLVTVPPSRDPLLPLPLERETDESLQNLSTRESEVMGMMVRGVTQKAIGLALGISVKTVATHRARLLRKLHLTGSFDLLRYALQNQLVQWSEVH